MAAHNLQNKDLLSAWRETEDLAQARGATVKRYTKVCANLPFYDLALGAIRAGNLKYLKVLLAKHPSREMGINHSRSFGLRATNADFSLLLATLYAEALTPSQKIAVGAMLLEAGFTLINMGRYVMGVSSVTALEAACMKVFMGGVEQAEHIAFIQLLLKFGGNPFHFTQPLMPCAYQRAREDYPYVLHEHGGPFPEASEELRDYPHPGIPMRAFTIDEIASFESFFGPRGTRA
jgi:hypothetical protein